MALLRVEISTVTFTDIIINCCGRTTGAWRHVGKVQTLLNLEIKKVTMVKDLITYCCHLCYYLVAPEYRLCAAVL